MVAALGGGIAMEFTVKELYAIEEIHSETKLLDLLLGMWSVLVLCDVLLILYVCGPCSFYLGDVKNSYVM